MTYDDEVDVSDPDMLSDEEIEELMTQPEKVSMFDGPERHVVPAGRCSECGAELAS